ncbi:DUF6446 family protein [Algicella marina]|uniref:Histidine kinase n=1 Tax=Algicella marina TaxID=2683284 RepID=A0A6P1SX00_9RHOB|nr:DUF6446 family protein [Algicella marina]QHQ34287.1 histidine kinase [Algicella marina]
MNGKIFITGLVAFLLCFGGALIYFQLYAYYQPMGQLTSISVADREIAVGSFEGINSDTSPNKLRACFDVDPAAFDGLEPATDAEPLQAPYWFGCFDAETLTEDLAAGRATAFVAEDETPANAVEYEILRFVAVYPDGRAYLWRHYREAE